MKGVFKGKQRSCECETCLVKRLVSEKETSVEKFERKINAFFIQKITGCRSKMRGRKNARNVHAKMFSKERNIKRRRREYFFRKDGIRNCVPEALHKI